MENPKINQDKEIVKVVKEAGSIKLIVDNMNVLSKETQIDATNLIKQIKGLKKVITERKDFFSKPINEVLKFVRAQAKEFMAPLDEMENSLRRKLIEFQNVLEEAERKAKEKYEKKMEKAIENDKPLPVEPPVHVEKKVKTEEATLSYKDVWKFEISDQSKIPAEYLIPDQVKIGKVVRAGIREIAGVRIYSIKEPSIR